MMKSIFKYSKNTWLILTVLNSSVPSISLSAMNAAAVAWKILELGLRATARVAPVSKLGHTKKMFLCTGLWLEVDLPRIMIHSPCTDRAAAGLSLSWKPALWPDILGLCPAAS